MRISLLIIFTLGLLTNLALANNREKTKQKIQDREMSHQKKKRGNL